MFWGGPEVLALTSDLAGNVPDLRIVIDHVANLRIDGRQPPQAWRDGIRSASQHRHVYCKVSGLVEGSGKRDGQAPAEVDFYRPVLDVVWQSFGSRRVVYGSNWPVSEPFANYPTVQRIVSTYVAERGTEASRRFFSKNALDVYQWIQR